MRKWRSYVLVVLGAYVLTLAFGTVLSPLRGNLETILFDQYQRWRPRPYNFDQPVRIVDIDDELLHLIGRWPWPRQTMADLVGRLAKANVAAIGFDVLFSEKDRPSSDVKACSASAVHSADEASRCEERADGDVAFAHAIADRPVVLGVFLTSNSQRCAGEPGDEGGLFLRRRRADAFPQSAAGSARPDSRSRGRRERAWLSQLAAGQRPRRSARPPPAQRRWPDPAEFWRWRRCVSPRARRAML